MRRSGTGHEVAGKRRRSVRTDFLWRAAVMAIFALPVTPFLAAGQHEAPDHLEVEWEGGASRGVMVTATGDGAYVWTGAAGAPAGEPEG